MCVRSAVLRREQLCGCVRNQVSAPLDQYTIQAPVEPTTMVVKTLTKYLLGFCFEKSFEHRCTNFQNGGYDAKEPSAVWLGLL